MRRGPIRRFRPSVVPPALVVAAAGGATLGGAGAGELAAQEAPPDERRALERVDALREEGRAGRARRLLEQILGARPASAGALERLLSLLREGGDVTPFLPFAEAAARHGEDGDAALHELWVRGLLEAGWVDSARSVAAAWADRRPSAGPAHASVAAGALAAADTAAAIAALERGLELAGPGPALLVPLVDLRAARGEVASLVEAWIALLRLEPGDPTLVWEGMRGSAGAGKAARDALWEAAAASPERDVREGAALVALRSGAAEPARRLADGALPEAPSERIAFLRRYAAEAERAGLPAEVSWAAERLIALSPRPIDRWRLRARSADMALAAGDTGRAREALRRLARETRPGEGPHGVAVRRLLAILAAEPGRVEEATALWDRYRRQYPDSTLALAEMAGRLALGHARAGRLADAERAAASARAELDDPQAVAILDAVAARLALFRGDREGAVRRLERAAAVRTAGAAGERTRRLAWLAALEGADSAEVAHVGRGAFALHRDPAAFRAERWLAGLDALPMGKTRPALLAAFAAELVAAGRDAEAAAVLLRVARRHPDAPEAPAALLDLARGATERDPATAREWLVRLITRYPESALAPLARRLLAELEDRVPGA